MKANFYSGFTLIEMVVVLAIITLLALMAVPSLLGSSMRSALKDGKESAELMLESARRFREKEVANEPDAKIAANIEFPGSYRALTSQINPELPLSDGEHFQVDLEPCVTQPDLSLCVRACLKYHSDLAKKIETKFSEDPHNLEGEDLRLCVNSMGGHTKAWSVRL